MKDFIISLLATVLLILLFSADRFPGDLPQTGSGTQYPGDSGMVLPGNGAEPAEVITESQKAAEREKAETNESAVASKEVHTEIIKEEQKSMNDIVLAFWHGVATVLIGETVALMVAIAWMKIRRKDNG